MYVCVCVQAKLLLLVCDLFCSMDGFRVVKLDSVLPMIDILITATGTIQYIQYNYTMHDTHRKNNSFEALGMQLLN